MASSEAESLRLIRVAGSDCAQFLQGQLTQDVRQITAGRSALFGWTNAQGRLLLVGQVFSWQEALWLSSPTDIAENLVNRLRQFVLRSRVTVDISGLAILGLAHPGSPMPLRLGAGELPAEPLACTGTGQWLATRVAGDPARVLVAADPTTTGELLGQLGSEAATLAEWHGADISAGLPSIGTGTTEAFIPQMVNLDLLGGVSFAKGCYSGQEIITRMRYLGRIKRRMFRFRCDGSAALTPGAPVFGAQGDAGRVVAAVDTTFGSELLAVTTLEGMRGPLFADVSRSRRLTRLDLPYEIPESAAAAPA